VRRTDHGGGALHAAMLPSAALVAASAAALASASLPTAAAQGAPADAGLPLALLGAFNTSLHARFFVLQPPAHLQRLHGNSIECQYFGHMYSFEWMYTDFFSMNQQYLAESAEEADFVVVAHCITYVYHILRYGTGFNTVALSWEALRMAQEDYLLPIVRWAQSTPAHQRFGGRNFVLVLAMDKGRVDYPLVSQATQHWHAITTVGNGTTWMQRNRPWLVPDAAPGGPEGGRSDPCISSTSTSKRRLIFFDQDVVVPVPTAFHWEEPAAQTDTRDLLVFYAGTPNSCIRRLIVEELAASPDADVLVVPKPIPRATWSGLLYRSRFCFVPDGFSSISARLYEVLLHGCVPVIFSHAFHPPFESMLDWRRLAVFLRRTQVREAPALLRSISEDRYLAMHSGIVWARRLFGPDQIAFWLATNLELELKSAYRRQAESATVSALILELLS